MRNRVEDTLSQYYKMQYILKYVHIQGGKNFPGGLSILKNNKM